MDSQAKQILEHLEAGYSITPLEALKLFGCLRLGARIWDLKKEGYKIKSELVTNNGKKFSEYTLIKQQKQLTIFN